MREPVEGKKKGRQRGRVVSVGGGWVVRFPVALLTSTAKEKKIPGFLSSSSTIVSGRKMKVTQSSF